VIIYLDFNKWIELSKFEHGKDTSKRARQILKEFRAAKTSGCIFPLSSVHHIEFSRISNLGRRKRLGSVMWEYSQGNALAPYGHIAEREIEVAFQKYVSKIVPRKLELIGRGVDFAFGVEIDSHLYQKYSDLFNKTMLTGSEELNIDPISSDNFFKQRKCFLRHLEEIHNKKHELEKSKWDDWLHALSMVDILDPINRVLDYHGIDFSFLSSLDISEHRSLLHSMPTRRLDIHLHRQVLKNPNYKAKMSDLEDWGGVGVASCYCDVVICEKHFADMLSRDKYRPKARIETKLENLLEHTL